MLESFTGKNMKDKIQELLKKEIPQRHSYFQLKYFVIGNQPTNQSKMWQCLRELKNRYDSLEALDLEVEETKDKIELIDIAIEKMEIDKKQVHSYGILFEKECDIKLRQLNRQKIAAVSNLSQLEEKKKWLEQECLFFVETYKNIEKIEPLKNFDDLDSQLRYWEERLSQKLNIKMLTNNQLDTELVETIVSLPDDTSIKKQIMTTLNIRHKTMLKQFQQTIKNIEEN